MTLQERRIELVKDLIKNGRTKTWLDYANQYGLEDGRTANDFWRYYQRTGRIAPGMNPIPVSTITSETESPKILIYDIETSQVVVKTWWSGTQYVHGNRMIKESKIISISWKWLGEDKIYDVVWDKDHCDKQLLEEFLPVYNSADMVIGVNNDRFDNRIINARAVKHSLDVNIFVRSFDIQKESKRLFRLPSYSMKYMCEYLDITLKLSHEGILMWDMVEDGTLAEQKEYLQKMVDYNRGDIVSTEEWYLKIRKYMGHKTHFGVMRGKAKWTSPDTGSENVKHYKNSYTPAGTIQRIMEDIDTGHRYRISNTEYMRFLEATSRI